MSGERNEWLKGDHATKGKEDSPEWIEIARLAVTLTLVLTLIWAKPSGRYQIPNGFNVPNPCAPGKIWGGVGHLDADDGGPINSFGEDFLEANFEWTVDLCYKDSDGDELTNGFELGDPNCKWSPGQIPERASLITHPGIHNMAACQS